MSNALVRLAYRNKRLRPQLLSLLKQRVAKIVVPIRHGESGEKIFFSLLASRLDVFMTQLQVYLQQLKDPSSDLKAICWEGSVNLFAFSDKFNSVADFLFTVKHFQKLSSWDPAYRKLWGLLENWVNFGVLGNKMVENFESLVRLVPNLPSAEELRYFDNPDEVHTLRKMAELYLDFKEMWAQAEERLAAKYGSMLDAPLPKGEKYETVYHASINAKELYRSGFQKELPSQAGLGGSQSAGGGKKGTSFTYDLYVAKEISRTLKELVLIAKGKIKANDVIHWASVEGVLERMFKIESLPKPYTLTIQDKNVRFFKGATEVPASQVFDTPLMVGTLYLWYLIAMDAKRYDPRVMFLERLLPKLAQANYQDIGVVAATVDMEYPGVRHLRGERELRVPPEAIVSVDKFFS